MYMDFFPCHCLCFGKGFSIIFEIIWITRNYGGEKMEAGSSSGTKSDEPSSKKNVIASITYPFFES